jgi:hypothetical protein
VAAALLRALGTGYVERGAEEEDDADGKEGLPQSRHARAQRLAEPDAARAPAARPEDAPLCCCSLSKSHTLLLLNPRRI